MLFFTVGCGGNFLLILLYDNKNKVHLINDTDKNLEAAIADKEDVIFECKRQLFDINTRIKLSLEKMEMLISKILIHFSPVFFLNKKNIELYSIPMFLKVSCRI